MTHRGDLAGKWHMYCADCGWKNHKNSDECSACGYGASGELFGVKDWNNVGVAEYTSDGQGGVHKR